MKTFKESIASIIFSGRWLQAPLYFGLIIILLAYVFRFLKQLVILVGHINSYNDTQVMLHALDLVDVVMIANLLIMVIIGGYETFVSRLNLKSHPDNPDWLDHVNAGSMKVKLALALLTISSIHLLRTFMDPSLQSNNNIKWQILIHITLVGSAIAIAFTNYIMDINAD